MEGERYGQKGTVTVETALALPLFLLALLALSTLFKMVSLELKIQAAMEGVVAKASAYTALLDAPNLAGEADEQTKRSVAELLVQGGVTAAYLELSVIEHVGKDVLDASGIVGGSGGLNPLGSLLPDGEGNLDFVLHYRVHCPFLPAGVGDIAISQRVCRRVWGGTARKGTEEGTQEEQLVYITDYGRVYHVTKSCSHLQFHIEMVQLPEVDEKRNSSGAKYYPCEKCAKNYISAVVYITADGNRYHSAMDCPALSRSIQEVPLSAVGSRTPCKTCAGKGE